MSKQLAKGRSRRRRLRKHVSSRPAEEEEEDEENSNDSKDWVGCATLSSGNSKGQAYSPGT